MTLSSTGRRLAIAPDVVAALEAAGLLEAFHSLPPSDRVRYGNWVEEAGSRGRAARVKLLLRIVHIWNKAH